MATATTQVNTMGGHSDLNFVRKLAKFGVKLVTGVVAGAPDDHVDSYTCILSPRWSQRTRTALAHARTRPARPMYDRSHETILPCSHPTATASDTRMSGRSPIEIHTNHV